MKQQQDLYGKMPPGLLARFTQGIPPEYKIWIMAMMGFVILWGAQIQREEEERLMAEGYAVYIYIYVFLCFLKVFCEILHGFYSYFGGLKYFLKSSFDKMEIENSSWFL